MAAVKVNHAFVSAKAAATDSTKVDGPKWNADEIFSGAGAIGALVYSDSGSLTGASWLPSVASGSVLASAGAGAAPAWTATPSLTSLTLSTPLGAPSGGTGFSSYTIGDIPYASASNALSKLAAVASGQVLTSAGTGTAPAWSTSPSVTDLTLGSSGTLAWSTDLKLVRHAANVLAQRNSTNAQVHRVYNTFTDVNNGEWFSVDWTQVANRCILSTAKNGSGTVREIGLLGANIYFYCQGGSINPWNMNASGHFVTGVHNSYDIGTSASSLAPRNIFVGGAVCNRVKAGTPTDSDVTNPADGMLIGDTSGTKIWIRLSGAWKSVAVA